MMRRLVQLVVFFLFSVSVLYSQELVSDMLKSAKYQLLYEDNFDTAGKPNPTDWLFRNNAKMGGISSPENVVQGKSTDGSNIDCLLIKFTADTTLAVDKQFVGGGVVSTHNFGYGYYETRVKLYGGTKQLSGLHQSFWSMGLTGTNEAEGKGVRDSLVNADAFPAENRVLEIDGFELDSKHNVLGQNYHIYTPSQKTQGPKPNHVEKDLSKWITMGYEWLPDRINYYADAVLFTTKELNGIWKVYAPQNFWFTALPVSLAAWGGLKVPPAGTAMQVDYFKFYARKLSGVNRVGNPGFEFGKIGNTYPTAWIVARTNGYNPDAVKVVADSSSTYEGRCFLQFKANKPCKALVRQVVEYIPNGTYTFSAYIKSLTEEKSAVIRIKSGKKVQQVQIPEAKLWSKIMLNHVVVSGNKAVIEIQSDLDVNQEIKIDNVEFKEK